MHIANTVCASTKSDSFVKMSAGVKVFASLVLMLILLVLVLRLRFTTFVFVWAEHEPVPGPGEAEENRASRRSSSSRVCAGANSTAPSGEAAEKAGEGVRWL